MTKIQAVVVATSLFVGHSQASHPRWNTTANSTSSQLSSTGLFSSSDHIQSSNTEEHQTAIGQYVAGGIGISTTSSTPSFESSKEVLSSSQSVPGSSLAHPLFANSSSSTYFAQHSSGPSSSVQIPSSIRAPYGVGNGTVYGSGGLSPSTVFGTGSGGGVPRASSSRGAPYAAPNGTLFGTGTGTYATGSQGNATLAPTGSGYSYANACNQASVSWTEQWATISYFTASTYYPTAMTTAPPNSDVYTLCDGIPRMRRNVTTQAQPFASLQQLIGMKREPGPEPICSIQPTDCSSLLLSYSSKHNVPASANLGPKHTTYEPFIVDDFPRCQTNTVGCGKPGADCAVFGTGIQLLYWPQTWAGGYCGDHKSIVTLGPTIPGKSNTATYGNYTLTSPTVYIKYSVMSARDICETGVGPTLTDGIFPIASDRVYSKVPYFMTNIPWEGPSGLMHIGREVGLTNAMVGSWPNLDPNYGDARVPVTYPDLDPETVPALPYFQREMLGGDPWCYYGGCPTMVPWNYFPRLDVPAEARSLAQEWASCTLAWGAMDDPPTAVAKMPTEASPTMSATATVTVPAHPRITATAVFSTKGPTAVRPTSTLVVPHDSPSPDGPRTKQPAEGETASQDTNHIRTKPIRPPVVETKRPSEIAPKQPSQSQHPSHEDPSPQVDPSPAHKARISPAAQVPTLAPAVSVVPQANTRPVTVGGATLSPDGKSGYLVGTQTLEPGSGVFVSGTSYSVDPAGKSVFVDGKGTRLPAETKAIVVDGNTVTPGVGKVEVSGTTYSVDPAGKTVYVNGTPSPVQGKHSQQVEQSLSQGEVEVNGEIVTAIKAPNQRGNDAVYIVGATTITAGGRAKAIGDEVVLANQRGLIVKSPETEAVFTQGSMTFSVIKTTDAAGDTGVALVHETILPDGRTKTITDDQMITQGSKTVIPGVGTVSIGKSIIALLSDSQTNTIPFSTTNEKSTIQFSALDSDETVLAVSGTAMVFSEKVTSSDGSRITEYIHGNTTLTATTMGKGTAREVQFVEIDAKTSATSSAPVSVSGIAAGSRIAAAAASPTAELKPTSTSDGVRANSMGSIHLFLSIGLTTLIFVCTQC